MPTYFTKSFKTIFLLSILLSLLGRAGAVDVSQNKEISLLEHSALYFDTKGLTLQEIVAKNLLKPYHKKYVNTGMLSGTIWIKFTLTNKTHQSIKKIVTLTSALLEHIALYAQGSRNNPRLKGVSHIKKGHHTLFPYFTIALDAQASKEYYLQIKSTLTPVDFALNLEDEKTYFTKDRSQQFVNILLVGFVFALALYSFILFFYTHDKSYIYYSLYLFALICQQMTYLGLTQIYFPLKIIAVDMQIPVLKVNILVITAALFAMHFLKIEQIPRLYFLYKLFIALSIIEIVLLGSGYFYNLNIVIFTGALFIIFNLLAGIISYKRGQKQARLFIVGFGIVFISYALIILDALGINSVVQGFRNILMFATAFEALILSLAFADRYAILQKEKEKADMRILMESEQRNSIIKQEVLKKTKELSIALEAKELLVKEVHHRVKNNLQMILSIIRLQNDEIEDKQVSQKFVDLESRINAISKTYSMLLEKDNLEEIDMQEYIDALLADVHNIFEIQEQHISIKTDIDAHIPLRQCVYIGLIVNELVSNAYKYAFDSEGGTIAVSLHQEGDYSILIIEDNGKGFVIDKRSKTLGLKLVHTLVYKQLGAQMEADTKNRTKYTIRFKL